MTTKNKKKVEQKEAKGAKKLPPLLPCPHCGAEAKHMSTETDLFWVGCSKGCSVTGIQHYPGLGAKIWNRRVPSLPSLPSVQNPPAEGGAK